MIQNLVYPLNALRRRYPRLPPGPKGYPIVGMIPSILGSPHEVLHELARKYGDLYLIMLGELPTVVISELTLLDEAFRLPELSDRWVSHVGKIFTNDCRDLGFSDYNDRWINFNRILNRYLLSPRQTARTFAEHAVPEVNLLLEKIDALASTGTPFELVELLLSSQMEFTFRSIFGADTDLMAGNDKVELIDCTNQFFRTAIKPNPQDYFPRLMGLPFPIVQRAKQHTANRDRIVHRLLENASRHPDTDLANPRLLVEVLLAREAAGELTRADALQLIGDLFLAAVHTTAHVTNWLVLNLLNRPEVYTRVQEELDAVTGREPEPEAYPREQLPYLNSVVRESNRYSTVAPLGVPHRAREDVDIGGYTIPGGAQVLGNLYSIHRDPRLWAHPDRFEPERFLHGVGKGAAKERNEQNERSYVPFGIGRRRCPGKRSGEQVSWLYACRLLRRYRFRTAPGTVRPLPEGGALGLVLEAQPFRVVATRRES